MTYPAFDYNLWAARYRTLAQCADAITVNAFLPEARLYLDDSDTSLIPDDAKPTLLNMVVAHLIALDNQASANPTFVGRVSSATEGSVSVAIEGLGGSGSAMWWQQTPYGAAFWRATAQYRTAQYVAAPPMDLDGFGWGDYNNNGFAPYPGAPAPRFPWN